MGGRPFPTRAFLCVGIAALRQGKLTGPLRISLLRDRPEALRLLYLTTIWPIWTTCRAQEEDIVHGLEGFAPVPGTPGRMQRCSPDVYSSNLLIAEAI